MWTTHLQDEGRIEAFTSNICAIGKSREKGKKRKEKGKLMCNNSRILAHHFVSLPFCPSFYCI